MDAVMFGYELDSVFDYWGTSAGRRASIAGEFFQVAKWLQDSEVKQVIRWAKGGKGLPSLDDWEYACRDAQRERRAKERALSDTRHVEQARFDAERSKGCRGGDCRACPVTYCGAIGEHCRDLSDGVRLIPKDGAVEIVAGEMRRLSRQFQGIGFDRHPDEHCKRHPVMVDTQGRPALDEHYARCGSAKKSLALVRS